MQHKNLLKSVYEKAEKKISLAKNINNWYIVNYKIVLMEFLCNMKKCMKKIIIQKEMQNKLEKMQKIRMEKKCQII